MNILEEITARKRIEVATRKQEVPYKTLEKNPLFHRQCLALNASLMAAQVGIIAEFKKRSPSKGDINPTANVAMVATGYAEAGAAGLSVLTEKHYFGGSDKDLTEARNSVQIPILRKDFTVDMYQVIEAKAVGADAILLIAACLTKKEVLEFAREATGLGLQVILEVHDSLELTALNEYITIVGVNNRNLKTFDVDIQISVGLTRHVPNEFLKISESGISSTESIRHLQQHGYKGFLIGENFMKEADPATALRAFINEITGENN